ncbi:hypothetical protein QCE73_37345 [Caballeronia sp. LZ029]|uniref:hypothetical protein n=1 Tax=Caballeronia sp. LZ029 TaxID=3038564 RepID=UPI002857DEBD|nr:hypothetical protein [Caballeronia sp. LZ029]MDR5748848.1 hypothetical protein [Caballeronia sp. LZ029]
MATNISAKPATEALNPLFKLDLIPRFRIPPSPAPTPAPAAALEPLPPVVLPSAPSENPFDSLPFPSPGDRIRADDFKQLSKALKLVAEMTSLSASLFGMTFGDAKSALLGRGFHLARVMSVFGTEIVDLADASLDARKVVQVVPAELGTHELMIVVSEAVDTRRYVPNFDKLTAAEAAERLLSNVGQLPAATPVAVPQFVGRTLDEVQ